ncbi:uncharacterized protein TNCV_1452851 [Trichonephila clavipes]|nr:uncharacterized protein TNCV_1452851 [Trichonephila clavipes]
MHLWTPQQWSCVMFLSLLSDSCQTLIWRVLGTRYHQKNTIERHRYGGAGWLVWGGTILGSRTDLHVQSLTTLASTCEFAEQENGLILDRIVQGIKDCGLQERLLQENNLNIQNAIEIVRVAEASREQIRNMNKCKIQTNILGLKGCKELKLIERIDAIECSIATRGLLATDHVILNHGQVTWTTPELAPHSPNYHTKQWEDVSALDRFNVHRCPTRRVFSGTGLELVTKQATARYPYHSSNAAMMTLLQDVMRIHMMQYV